MVGFRALPSKERNCLLWCERKPEVIASSLWLSKVERRRAGNTVAKTPTRNRVFIEKWRLCYQRRDSEYPDDEISGANAMDYLVLWDKSAASAGVKGMLTDQLDRAIAIKFQCNYSSSLAGVDYDSTFLIVKAIIILA